MWTIVSKVYGEAATPHSSNTSVEIDTSRYAMFVAKNDELGITLPLSVYLPLKMKECKEVIFSIHGIGRNANKYRNIFVPHVQDKEVLIVAPSFTDWFYHHPTAVKLGNMCRSVRRKNHDMVPKSEWTFTHLYQIFQLLQTEFEALEWFSLFGHSAGAQFVHRMVLFTDYKELKNAVAANSGWYTTLDAKTVFPYGIKGIEGTNLELKHHLNDHLTLLIGEKDIEQDLHLRLTKRAFAQGANRLERAVHMFSIAKQRAKETGTTCKWRLVTVPDVAHSSRLLAPVALDYLLA